MNHSQAYSLLVSFPGRGRGDRRAGTETNSLPASDSHESWGLGKRLGQSYSPKNVVWQARHPRAGKRRESGDSASLSVGGWNINDVAWGDVCFETIEFLPFPPPQLYVHYYNEVKKFLFFA